MIKLIARRVCPAKLLLILFAGSLVACSTETPSDAADVYHHLASGLIVEQVDQYEVPRQFAGLVVPSQSTDIGFELGGEVAMMQVDEGARVESGQPLALLDTRLLDAERDQLQAQQNDLRARLQLNRTNWQRQNDLKERGFAADQRLDELAAEYQSLNANLAQLDASLMANRTRLDKARLVAPFGGTISRRFVDEGAVVGAGQTVFRLLEEGMREARVGVPARLVDRLAVGDQLPVWSAGQTWQGTVLAIGSDITRATLTVPVRVALPVDANVVAGDQAYLNLAETVVDSGFWVPMTALTDGVRGLWNVYVMQPSGNGLQRIEQRDVIVVYSDDERAFVRGALADSETIVAAGLQRLVPGQQVRLQQTEVAQLQVNSDD